jgi:putative Mg2+ transporter-C (MgtC) family protein
MGAAAFVDLGFDVHGPAGPSQVIAYVVAGIGFLGAGVIMKDGGQVRGLNTAATLWCSAAVGACAGAGQVAQAGVLTLFVLAGNTLLRPLVNAINRRPLDSENSEALYQVHLVCAPSAVAEMRELLFQELEKADYPIQGIELLSETDDSVELAATLVPTTAVAAELDAVVARLEAAPGARSVSWTAGATS